MTSKAMSVSDLLKQTTCSGDFGSFDGSPESWMEVINYKANDSGFFRLIDSIMENGWEEGSYIGWTDGYLWEGHHRVVAAILLGLDEIMVPDEEAETWQAGDPRTLTAHQEWGVARAKMFDYYEPDPSWD
jgi:hypothetical protein